MDNIWNIILKKRDIKDQYKYSYLDNESIENISRLTLLQLANRDMAIQIFSEVLNCEIWLCSNEEMEDQIKNDDPSTITYTVNEIINLINLHTNPDELRRVHETKETFRGSKVLDSKLKVNIDKKN